MIKVALSLRPTHESIATTRRRTTTRHRFSVKASSNNDDDLNDEAKIVAEHLVLANLTGHDSHGVGMLPTYFRMLKSLDLYGF